jgi:hypothetical protein
MLIQTEPSDAMVYLDGEKMGPSPVSVNFVHYGTREIVLMKRGFQTVTTYEKVSPPWYEVFPIDFFSEVLWPWTLRDEHTFRYTLEPKTGETDPEKLLNRARATRKEAKSYK